MTAIDDVLALGVILAGVGAAAALFWSRWTVQRQRNSRDPRTPNWIWHVDLEGTILSTNESCLEIVGYTADELVGQNAAIFMDPSELQRVEAMVKAAGVPEEGLDSLIISATHRDGSSSWLEVRIHADLDASGAMVGCRGVSRHIGPGAAQVVASRASRARIQRIIDNRLLVTAFQPIVDLRTGSVLGVEALSRMLHEPSPPDVWFAEAAAVGLGTDLELLAVKTSLAAAVALPTGLYVSINASPETCLDQRLAAMIESSSIDPRRLVLEVTEHKQVLDYAPLNAALARFRQSGIRIAIDDAGAGFASGQHMVKIRPDIIKLDRSIISDIDVQPDQRALAAGYVAFASHIGAVLTAEGIETAQEAAAVVALGIQCGQGYLFGQATFEAREWNTWNTPPAKRMLAPSGRSVSGEAGRAELFTGETAFGIGILDAIPDPSAVVDATGKIIAVNRAWRAFSVEGGGEPGTTGVGTSYLDVCSRAAADGSSEALEALRGLRAVLSGEAIVKESEYACHKPDRRRWFLSRISSIDGIGSGALISHVNITRRRRSEEELVHQSSCDPVTGLANHLLFDRRLTESLRVTSDQPGPTAGVISISLEGLTAINDRDGRTAGDGVLMTAAERLIELIRPQDTAARIGGTRFAVCAPNIAAPELLSMADRISTTLGRAYEVQGRLVTVTVGVGSHLTAPGVDPADAIRAADHDLYDIEQLQQLTTPTRTVKS